MAQAPDTTWNGSVQDGDWANDSNWSGIVPISTDVIQLSDSSEPITTGLDQSLVDPAALIITPTMTGSIASSGSPLRFGTITTLSMSGLATETWIDANVTLLTVDMQNLNTNAFVICSVNAGTLTNSKIHRGKLQFGAACTFTADVGAPNVSDLELTVVAGSTCITLRVNGGKVFYSASAGTPDIELNDGEIQQLLGLVTSLIQNGGTYLWKAGTITGGIINMGTFDAATMKGIKTIGANDLIIHENANVNLRDISDLIAGDVKPFGNPRILFNDGITITL